MRHTRRYTLSVSVVSNYKAFPQGPLVGPWGVVPGYFNYETTQTPIIYLPSNFRTFPTPKSYSNMLRHTNTPLSQLLWRHGRSWTILFLNLINELYSLKMELETSLISHGTFVRLCARQWGCRWWSLILHKAQQNNYPRPHRLKP